MIVIISNWEMPKIKHWNKWADCNISVDIGLGLVYLVGIYGLVQANVRFVMEEEGALIVSDEKCIIVHTARGEKPKATASMKKKHSLYY